MGRRQTQAKERLCRGERMKFIFIPLFWAMIPLAFIVVVFDVAKSFVEDRVEAKFKDKNT